MFPQEKQPLVINWEGEDYTIGELNIVRRQGYGVRVTAASEFTILDRKSEYLKISDGYRDARRGEVCRWQITDDQGAVLVCYEYVVMSDCLPGHHGWLMRRIDTMPRVEPRAWDRQGDELASGAARLEEIAAVNRADTSAAREAAGSAGWQRSRSHEDAAGVAFPRLHRMAVRDDQLLLTFRSATEADVFWRWVTRCGWDMFGGRDELL